MICSVMPMAKLPRQPRRTFACKRCLKSFQKDMSAFEEADEFCPHCNNRFVIDAELADDLEAEQALAEVEAEA